MGPADRQPDQPEWQLEQVACDYCGRDEAEVLWAGPDRLHGLPGRFAVVRCCECGLVRTSPRPSLACLGAAYPEEYGPHQAKTLRARRPRGLTRWALRNLRGYPLGRRSAWPLRWLLRPVGWLTLKRRRASIYLPYRGEGRLLDFGCGAGGYVAKMAAAGWRAEGMDMSDEAVRIGREAGLTMHQGTLPGAELAAGSYDVVTMWHVLEHVPAPLTTLRAARRLLKPGGTLLAACPQLDSLQAAWFGGHWFALDLPRHLTHFTRKTLRRHLEAAGFEVERIVAFRRPSTIRKSFAYLAEDTGRRLHRRMARSRLLAGLASHFARLTGRAAQMICLARPAAGSGERKRNT